MLSLVNRFVYRPDATFAPSDLTPQHLSLPYENVPLHTEDGLNLAGWYLPAADPRYTLLYCHGNAGSIRDWIHAAPPFLAMDCSLLLWDYRGYGDSEGEPSEEGLYRDAHAAWRWLQQRAADEELPAFILGKSLGSAVATQLVAAGSNPTGLILDSAFTSMRAVIAANVPAFPMDALPQLYESLVHASIITGPTLVIHGAADSLVPLAQGKRIYAALQGPKAMKVIGGAEHNDLVRFPEYHASIAAFLRDPVGYTAA